MIVVIGTVVGLSGPDDSVEPGGFAAHVALAAARQGALVELVTRLGDDDVGDAVLLGLARAGIGHVATLRDAAHRTPLLPHSDGPVAPDGDGESRLADDIAQDQPTLEAADVGLALRYLPDHTVIVVAHTPDAGLIDEAVSAAAFAGAHLIVVSSPDSPIEGVPDTALALSVERDAEEVAARLGRYAAAVDAGEDRDTAFAVLTAANGVS